MPESPERRKGKIDVNKLKKEFTGNIKQGLFGSAQVLYENIKNSALPEEGIDSIKKEIGREVGNFISNALQKRDKEDTLNAIRFMNENKDDFPFDVEKAEMPEEYRDKRKAFAELLSESIGWERFGPDGTKKEETDDDIEQIFKFAKNRGIPIGDSFHHAIAYALTQRDIIRTLKCFTAAKENGIFGEEAIPEKIGPLKKELIHQEVGRFLIRQLVGDTRFPALGIQQDRDIIEERRKEIFKVIKFLNENKETALFKDFDIRKVELEKKYGASFKRQGKEHLLEPGPLLEDFIEKEIKEGVGSGESLENIDKLLAFAGYQKIMPEDDLSGYFFERIMKNLGEGNFIKPLKYLKLAKRKKIGLDINEHMNELKEGVSTGLEKIAGEKIESQKDLNKFTSSYNDLAKFAAESKIPVKRGRVREIFKKLISDNSKNLSALEPIFSVIPDWFELKKGDEGEIVRTLSKEIKDHLEELRIGEASDVVLSKTAKFVKLTPEKVKKCMEVEGGIGKMSDGTVKRLKSKIVSYVYGLQSVKRIGTIRDLFEEVIGKMKKGELEGEGKIIVRYSGHVQEIPRRVLNQIYKKWDKEKLIDDISALTLVLKGGPGPQGRGVVHGSPDGEEAIAICSDPEDTEARLIKVGAIRKGPFMKEVRKEITKDDKELYNAIKEAVYGENPQPGDTEKSIDKTSEIINRLEGKVEERELVKLKAKFKDIRFDMITGNIYRTVIEHAKSLGEASKFITKEREYKPLPPLSHYDIMVSRDFIKKLL